MWYKNEDEGWGLGDRSNSFERRAGHWSRENGSFCFFLFRIYLFKRNMGWVGGGVETEMEIERELVSVFTLPHPTVSQYALLLETEGILPC